MNAAAAINPAITPAEIPPVATPDELDLMARIASGDEVAFERLVRTHTPRMLNIARRMVRSPQEADDVVQDAFLSVFRKAGTFSGSSRLATWLHRVTVNAALMRIRSADRHASIERWLPTFLEDGHHANPPDRWPDQPFARLSLTETKQAVRAAIDQLPDSYRDVLLLRDIEQQDTDATAELLNTTPGNVKTRLHRARQALRTLLSAYA